MNESIDTLRKRIDGATELGGIVRTMKSLAAASLGQFENSVKALDEYYRTIQLGLFTYFKSASKSKIEFLKNSFQKDLADVIIFGSDQGLVGRFNEVVYEFADKWLVDNSVKIRLWAAGERIENILLDAGYTVAGKFPLPNSVAGISPFIGNIITHLGSQSLFVFHNCPHLGNVYSPVLTRVLPLDALWEENIMSQKWPTRNIPEILGDNEATFRAYIREYIFVSLFRVCAESLAAENASRLAAMQRAEKNINEMLDELRQSFHRFRQESIDEELFDVIAGFEALKKS